MQLGANLCHTDDCHQLTSHKELKGAQFEKKSEECSVCQLQLNNHLYYEDFNVATIEVRIEKSFLPQTVLTPSLISREASGRSPPSLI